MPCLYSKQVCLVDRISLRHLREKSSYKDYRGSRARSSLSYNFRTANSSVKSSLMLFRSKLMQRLSQRSMQCFKTLAIKLVKSKSRDHRCLHRTINMSLLISNGISKALMKNTVKIIQLSLSTRKYSM